MTLGQRFPRAGCVAICASRRACAKSRSRARRVACYELWDMASPVLVRNIMSKDVVTFFAEQTLPLAEDVMRIHKFRHLPVVDNERRLVGLVSRSDILRAQISVLTGL